MGTRRYSIAGGAPPFTGSENWTGVPEAADAIGAGVFPYVSLYTSPPPDEAWDLEARNMTDPDLAANGWTVSLFNVAPWTVLTRVGNIDFAVAPGAGQYRSSLINGRLFVQTPTGAAVQIVRAVTATSGFTIKTHASCALFAASNVACALISNTAQPGNGPSSRVYYAGLDSTNVNETLFTGALPGSYNVLFNSGVTVAQSDLVSYVDAVSVTESESLVVTALEGQRTKARTTRATAIAATHAGMFIAQAAGGITMIDFIRRTALRQFP